MRYRFTFSSESYADREADLGLEMPDGHRGPVPRGHALVFHLIEALEGRRWEVPFRWATDYAHAFEARGGGYRFDVMVVCLDAEAGSWEVTAERRTGLLPWLRKRNPAMLRALARDLRACLREDPAITDVLLDDSGQVEPLDPATSHELADKESEG